MMKKKIIIVLIAVFVLSGGAFAIFNFLSNARVQSFSLDDYQAPLTDFPSDKVCGEVTSARVAKEKAESIWLETFGKKIQNEKPYKVFFDESQDVWLITGTLHKSLFSSTKGGVAYMLIQKSDGKVLAVWHDQ